MATSPERQVSTRSFLKQKKRIKREVQVQASTVVGRVIRLLFVAQKSETPSIGASLAPSSSNIHTVRPRSPVFFCAGRTYFRRGLRPASFQPKEHGVLCLPRVWVTSCKNHQSRPWCGVPLPKQSAKSVAGLAPLQERRRC